MTTNAATDEARLPLFGAALPVVVFFRGQAGEREQFAQVFRGHAAVHQITAVVASHHHGLVGGLAFRGFKSTEDGAE